MNDKDFDKLFGDQLGQELPFDYEEKDWQKLSQQLDVANLSQPPKFAWRNWLWLFLPLLLLLNLWQMGRSNAIIDQNKALFTEMTALKNSLNVQPTLTRDTVFIRHTDTIVVTKTIVKKEFIPQLNNSFLTEKGATNQTTTLLNSPVLPQNNSHHLEKISIDQSNENHSRELLDKIKGLENKLIALQQSIDNQQLTTNAAIQKAEAMKDSLLAIASADSAKKAVPPNLTKLDNTQKSPLSIIQPKPLGKSVTARLFVGLNGGLINYKSLWLNTLGIEIGRNVRSYQMGLKAEYALTDRLRLTAGSDFCPFEIENYWRDSRYNLPDPTFNYWTEKFFAVRTRQELLQGFLGAKYMLTDGRKRWRPYVGAAYTAMKIRPFSTEYEYKKTVDNSSRFETIQSEGKNIGKLLMASGGVEYRLNNRFVSQLDAFYYFDLNRPRKTYDLFGLRGALLLNF